MTSLEEPVHVYAVGTAGSGKTRFSAAFQKWMKQAGHDVVLVNLDPGAEQLPYTPDVDIRDWIVLGDVMQKYGLGPNGAQVVAADLLALRAGEIKEILDDFRTDYVLFDTPGQTELFVFRDSGRIFVDVVGRERSMVAFLVDPFLARKASGFATQMLLASTVNFRFGMPQVNVLTKADLMKDEDVERLQTWAHTPDELLSALMDERADVFTQLTTDVARILDAMGASNRLLAVSSETAEGFEDVYAHAQNVVLGGEDLDSGRETRDAV